MDSRCEVKSEDKLDLPYTSVSEFLGTSPDTPTGTITDAAVCETSTVDAESTSPNHTGDVYIELDLLTSKAELLMCGEEREPPRPLCSVLPTEPQSQTSVSRSQSLKPSEPPNEDLCASVLLSCLFCNPLDCISAMLQVCTHYMWSPCTFLCGCEPTTFCPLLNLSRYCDLCGGVGVRCFLCDCPISDICLHATECLDLGMEISQMLYH